MLPRPPYNWPDVAQYPPAAIWLGWDGVYKWIDRDGTVSLTPILPEKGCPPRRGANDVTPPLPERDNPQHAHVWPLPQPDPKR